MGGLSNLPKDNPFVLLKKCQDQKCGNLFTKSQLKNAEKKLNNTTKKKCNKIKDFSKTLQCEMSVLQKSELFKLQKKKTKCAEVKCKKEKENFRKKIVENLKKFKKTMKNKKRKKKQHPDLLKMIQ